MSKKHFESQETSKDEGTDGFDKINNALYVFNKWIWLLFMITSIRMDVGTEAIDVLMKKQSQRQEYLESFEGSENIDFSPEELKKIQSTIQKICKKFDTKEYGYGLFPIEKDKNGKIILKYTNENGRWLCNEIAMALAEELKKEGFHAGIAAGDDEMRIWGENQHAWTAVIKNKRMYFIDLTPPYRYLFLGENPFKKHVGHTAKRFAGKMKTPESSTFEKNGQFTAVYFEKTISKEVKKGYSISIGLEKAECDTTTMIIGLTVFTINNNGGNSFVHKGERYHFRINLDDPTQLHPILDTLEYLNDPAGTMKKYADFFDLNRELQKELIKTGRRFAEMLKIECGN